MSVSSKPEIAEPLRSIFVRFLKFGCLAWGGPAAQIAMIKRECVEEEMWISEVSFQKLLAVYQVLPGPEAHELCVYFGRLRGGKRGGFLAGLGFMLPGFILMLGLSYLYTPSIEGGSNNSGLQKAGGMFGLLAAFLAWYVALAGLADNNNSFFTIPVWHFPWSEKGRSAKQKTVEADV